MNFLANILKKIGTNAARYDFGTWILGIWKSFISAGAGAGGSVLAPMLTDPDHFNVNTGLTKIWHTMIVAFIVFGVAALLKFLHDHPAPDPIAEAAKQAAVAMVNLEAAKEGVPAQEEKARAAMENLQAVKDSVAQKK